MEPTFIAPSGAPAAASRRPATCDASHSHSHSRSDSDLRARRLLGRPEAIFGFAAVAASLARTAASRATRGAVSLPARAQADLNVRAAAAARAAARRKYALLESEVLATRATVGRVRSAVRAAERAADRAMARAEEDATGTCGEDVLAEAEHAADGVCAELALAEGVLLRVQEAVAGSAKEKEAAASAHRAAWSVMLEKEVALEEVQVELSAARARLAAADEAAQDKVDRVKAERDALAVRLGALNSRLGALVTQRDAEIAGKARVQLDFAEAQQLLDATLRELIDTQQRIERYKSTADGGSVVYDQHTPVQAASAPTDKRLLKLRGEIKYMRNWLSDRSEEEKQAAMLSVVVDRRADQVIDMQNKLAAAEKLVVTQEIDLEEDADDAEAERHAADRSQMALDLIRSQLVADSNSSVAVVKDAERTLMGAGSSDFDSEGSDDFSAERVIADGEAIKEALVVKQQKRKRRIKDSAVDRVAAIAAGEEESRKGMSSAQGAIAKATSALKNNKAAPKKRAKKLANAPVFTDVDEIVDELDELSVYGESAEDVDDWWRARNIIDIDEARKSALFVKQLALSEELKVRLAAPSPIDSAEELPTSTGPRTEEESQSGQIYVEGATGVASKKRRQGRPRGSQNRKSRLRVTGMQPGDKSV
jgi:hypothetical protein